MPVTYATHDGAALMADAYAPTGAGPFPAFVAVHGGGWQAGARSTFQYWGPYLAERGYVLFAISYRLAKKGQKMFPQAVQDALAAVQFVRAGAQTLKVDPERIGVFGASAGTHLAALAALGGERFKGGGLSERRTGKRQHQGGGAGWRLRCL
jgi:acetyl esterase/lipase